MATAAKKAPPKKGNTGKTVAGVKIAKKKPTVRRAHLADEKYTGSEPVWDTERAMAMSDAEFDHHLRRSFYYYNYHYTSKDLKPDLVKWLAEQTHFKLTKADISKVAKGWVPMTACSLVTSYYRGMPLKANALKYIETAIRDCVEKYVEDDSDVVEAKDTPKAAPIKVTIQDRLNEKASELIGEIDGWYDNIILGGKDEPDVYNFLKLNNVPQASLGKFETAFSKYKAELLAAQNKEDPQLVEGYRHMKAADFKRHFAWLDALQAGFDQYRAVKKATKKARVKKSPSKEKLVAKLKYLKQDNTLKLVSINPVDIVGATELWVYNVKTRKLGKYVPGAYKDGISVKGTTILDFDEAKSVQKTLRKPEQQLMEFMKAGKVNLRKYMDTIKTTEIVLNGRINEDTLLLRVA